MESTERTPRANPLTWKRSGPSPDPDRLASPELAALVEPLIAGYSHPETLSEVANAYVNRMMAPFRLVPRRRRRR